MEEELTEAEAAARDLPAQIARVRAHIEDAKARLGRTEPDEPAAGDPR